MLNQQKIDYLFVGGFNALAGYFIGVSVYKVLGENFGIVWVGIASNILSITVSFLTYKILVFRTKGKWLMEYLKAYLVYGGAALVGIFFLWIFVDLMKMSIWFAQALAIGLTVIFSYVGHSKFTFRHR